jgi:hypothetical protein
MKDHISTKQPIEPNPKNVSSASRQSPKIHTNDENASTNANTA